MKRSFFLLAQKLRFFSQVELFLIVIFSDLPIFFSYPLSSSFDLPDAFRLIFLYFRWRRHARKDRKVRLQNRSQLLEKMFSCWCTYVPLQKSKRILRNTVEKKFTLVSDKFKVQISVFQFFFSWTSYFLIYIFLVFLVAFSSLFFMNFTTNIAADAANCLLL